MIEIPPSLIVARYLIEQQVAFEPTLPGNVPWRVYAGYMPDSSVDNTISIGDPSGIEDGVIQRTGETIIHYGIQVRVRTSSYPDGWQRGAMIANALDQMRMNRLVVAGTVIIAHAFKVLIPLCFMGNEEQNQRANFVLNGTLTATEDR